MKIANKISLSFFITALVLTGVCSPVFYITARNSLKDRIYAHLETTAQSRAHHIETFLVGHKKKVEIMADSALVETALETIVGRESDSTKLIEETSLELKEFIKTEVDFYEIFVLNPDGRIVTSTEESNIGLDRSTDAYFLGAKEGVYIKDAYYSTTTNRRSIAISALILDDETRECLGVLVARLDLTGLDEIACDRTGLGKTGEIYIVNEHSYMITPSRFKEDTFLKLKVDTENTRAYLEGVKKFGGKPHRYVPFTYTDYRGVKVLGMHDHIPQMTWGLLAKIDAKEVLAPLAKIKFLFVIITIFVPIAAWLIGIFFSRVISTPISKLQMGAEIIGRGNLDYKVGMDTKDEIGRLSQAFDEMSADLKESYLRLKDSHKQLEEKVQERTAELSSTNRKLQEEIEERSSVHKRLRQHIKQLNCLYGLSKLIEKQKIPLEKIFQEAPNLIRNAYRSPDITSVRITFEGIPYTTDNFEKSELSQHAHIMVRGEKVGGIEVYWLGEETDSGQATFLQEERSLLDAVAKRLGRTAERKKAAGKRQLFRNLIDKSNDSIFVIEPEWGRFLDINDRACENLGYTRQELLRMSFRDIDETTPDDSAWTQHVKEVRQKGYVVLEGRLKRKDGTTFPVEMNVKLIEQEKGNYILVVAWDLTEQKLAEKRQAELFKEVKSANQELKDFAYIISHDLKAPLRGIKTLANWISTDYADKLDDNGREQIDLLTRRVERMHNLIDGVLQYSRVGRTKEEKVKVNLNDLVAEVIDTVAPPENIEIIVENELPVIECEETRIIQVFQNLLSNAVKYMDKPQGQIVIGCVEENGFWKFSVTDSGPGIEEKHFERIFRIFQTLLPRDEFESTGVGLTVVKKIVELYGGNIWVESKLGEGCTFFFTLPKQEIEMGLKDAKLEANIVSQR